MNWIDCIYFLAIIGAVFTVGFCIGHMTGLVGERARWWEAQARAARNVEVLASKPKQETDFVFPDEIDAREK